MHGEKHSFLFSTKHFILKLKIGSLKIWCVTCLVMELVTLLGLKVHHSIQRNLLISPRAKQDYHSLATQGRPINVTIGGLPRI